MSAAIEAVLDRTMRDEAFLDAFRANPEEAIEEYDLSDEEREALLAGDEREVRELLASPGPAGYTLLMTSSASE